MSKFIRSLHATATFLQAIAAIVAGATALAIALHRLLSIFNKP